MEYLNRLTNVSGLFTADQSCHLAMTICPHHREIYGLRWKSGKVRCCVPIEVAGHKVVVVVVGKKKKKKHAEYHLSQGGAM